MKEKETTETTEPTIKFGEVAAIREASIVMWARQHPTISFSPNSVCAKIYKDIYPNGQIPQMAVAAYYVACVDLKDKGILKLERIVTRKKTSVPIYVLNTDKGDTKEEPENEGKIQTDPTE